MAEMLDLLKKTIQTLEKNKIEYVIVGGVAAIYHGSARTTSDIDIIISPQLDSHIKYFDKQFADFYIKLFSDANFDVMENQLRFAFKEKSNLSIFGKDTIIRLDVKVAKTDDEIEVLKNAEYGNISGLKFKLASIEQILYGKILYLGDVSDLEDEELLDFNDVRDFINVYNKAIKVDISWLEKKASKKNLLQTLQRLQKIAKKYAIN